MKMKASDAKQLRQAQNDFDLAMCEYYAALKDVAELSPNIDQLNALTRQIRKLTKTIERAKEQR